MRDDARAPDGKYTRSFFLAKFPSGLQQHHPDDPIPCERIGEHLSIARLKDVQGQQHVREEHDRRQREDWNDGRNHRVSE
jgi:hypothetical protein